MRACSSASVQISIHAPRKGERRKATNVVTEPELFQSTLPARGSDHQRFKVLARADIFQSTLPARGSDTFAHLLALQLTISIHAPRKGERLYCIGAISSFVSDFNPRSPQGGAT